MDALARADDADGSTLVRAAWAIGNFDGVHLGHRRIVERLRARASASSAEPWVLTFDPHPTAVLRPERPLVLLTSIDRRLELLEGLGVAGVVVTPFDDAIAKLAPADFAAGLLRERMGACAVVVGSDFRFGAGRAGDVVALASFGAAAGFVVEVVEPVEAEGSVVSSTRVRAKLGEGDVRAVARLLARSHDVDGIVVEGQRRGRTLGFPTANLETVEAALPCDGVYACRARLDDGRVVPAVANLGVRPTVAAGRSLEAHLLDFDGDLYGSRVRLAFVDRIRDEKKFAGLDELRAQIAADVARGRVLLAEDGPR
ncbi:MAG: bifunctional riboflavin kinase/FAD synthetase [Deltaproteobacteria bacterium]|nr:bifunctional riboflavin kinase/FAD synthetase [Deltaproteobacteria bacterium]